jgi:hypothetical protein
MNQGVIITLPKWDNVTEYLTVFSKVIVEEAYKKYPTKIIEGQDVNKDNFQKVLKKLDYNCLIINGHGSQDSICGHKNQPLIELGKDEDLLKERITYARSCWAAYPLGKSCVQNTKCGCFIGYKIPFMFFYDETRLANPIKDSTAKIFFDTSNMVALSLIKGHTTQEANEITKRSMLKAINKALKNGDKDSRTIAETLWNNYVGQVLFGNPDSKI